MNTKTAEWKRIEREANVPRSNALRDDIAAAKLSFDQLKQRAREAKENSDDESYNEVWLELYRRTLGSAK